MHRRYLGQIGVRPVDIAIDPASRVVDAISSILFLLGFFGPLLFVGLRLDRIRDRRAVWGGLVALGLFVAVLSVEPFVIGPKFDTTGVGGHLMPQVVGVKATPMRVLDVDNGVEDELLYLGENAGLYVLVDPCDDDDVFYVSVGATQLLVIDEIAC